MAKSKKKLDTMNEIMCKMEKQLEKLTDPKGHDLQWNEVLNLVHGWLQTHAPHAQETYTDDGSHPEFYYGPRKIRK